MYNFKKLEAKYLTAEDKLLIKGYLAAKSFLGNHITLEKFIKLHAQG